MVGTIQERAQEATEWFKWSKRDETDEDSYFVSLKDGAPQWVKDLVYAAHHGWSDFMPDDYRYQWTRDALEFIAESDDPDDSHEFADSAVDVYTGRRLQWLSSNLNRPSYCDEARTEFGGGDTDIISMIGLGQYMEASEVYGLVLQALQS